MKTFNQFILEGRDAPLYHGTNFSNAELILRFKIIKTAMADQDERNCISLTRNMKFAFSWVKEAFGSDGIVFELDQAKIAQTYKIRMFDYHQQYFGLKSGRRTETTWHSTIYPNESEEYVGKDIHPLEKYLLRIITKGDIDLSDFPRIANHPLLYSIKTKSFVNQ